MVVRAKGTKLKKREREREREEVKNGRKRIKKRNTHEKNPG